jgi:uncharacterized repeat protein (TIGR03803 family)
MKKTHIALVFALLLFSAHSQTTLFGTEPGGEFYGGKVFRVNTDASDYAVAHDFDQIDCYEMTGHLVEAGDGNLYGLSSNGTMIGGGVLFQYNKTTGVYTRKHQFNTNVGAQPTGSLVKGQNGKLYGLTSAGGNFSAGVLFEYDPIVDTIIKKIDFDNTTTGGTPKGTLIQASNGKFYGLSEKGGLTNYGTLFEYDLVSNSLTKKIDFNGVGNGRNPVSQLFEASNGMLYGMTPFGGVNDTGVLFRYDIITNTLTKQVDFDNSTSGSMPQGSLIEGNNGKLYGLTLNGGLFNLGVLFSFDPAGSGTYAKQLDFNSANGSSPSCALTLVADGTMYGVTSGGGSAGIGLLFQYDPSTNILTPKVHSTNSQSGFFFMQGELMLASDGMYYGLSDAGGMAGMGTLYQYNPITNTGTVKLSTYASEQGFFVVDAPLTLAPDSMLYGVTHTGGDSIQGVIYQLDPADDTYIKKASFIPSLGCGPIGKLTVGPDGNLYGMTYSCGTNNGGTIFRYTLNTGIITKLYDLSSVIGSSQRSSLLYASNGKIYGTRLSGGAYNYGTLFEFDPVTTIFQTRVDFNDTANGSNAYASLMQATNGMIYGLTAEGGANDDGSLFQYDPVSNIFTKKIDLSSPATGSYPLAHLTQVTDSTLYGVCFLGGTFSYGVLFEYNLNSNILTKKHEFNTAVTGANPYGPLLKASDGFLYGTTVYGGPGNYSRGTVFKYDVATNTPSLLHDFEVELTSSIVIADLTEVTYLNPVSTKQSVKKESRYNLFPNPGTGIFSINTDQPAQIIVINSFGREVYRKTIDSADNKIDLRQYAEGIYFVKMSAKLVEQTFKVMLTEQ